MRKDYGDIAALVGGRKEFVFAFGPQYNQLILTRPDIFCYQSMVLPGPENSAQRRLCDAIFSMNGEQALERRKLLAPPLHRRAVDGYRDIIVETVDKVLQRWPVGGTLDAAAELKRLTIWVSGKILFALDENSKHELIAGMIERWLHKATSPAVRLLRINWPGTPYHSLLAFADRLEKILLELIAQRREQDPGGTDIFSILVRANHGCGARVSDSELIGETNLWLLAAYETTFTALTWTLFFLLQHPKVADDVVSELRDTLHGGAPDLEQLKKLPLLERVIKESMRLVPPVIYHTRMSTQPFELGRYYLPERVTVGFSHYITHHMAEIYPEPEKFVPDRWQGIEPSPYEYLAFGVGPRACMGAPFAMMVMKIALAMILQRYRLRIAEGARIDRQGLLTLSPKYGMPVQVLPEHESFRRVPVRGNIHEIVQLS